jgi:hypothetical protein
LDNISTTLLCQILTEINDLMKKLETRDVAKELNSINSVYVAVEEDTDEDQTGIIGSLDSIISVCKSEKYSLKKNETVWEIIDVCNSAKEMLSEEYPRKTRLGNKNNLQEGDRIHLIEVFEELIEEIINRVEDSEINLNLEPKKSLDVDKRSLKVLDKSAKLDLEEGLALLQLGHTTAAYMILMRVAESFVLKYYQKITGSTPPNNEKAWGTLLEDLKPYQVSKVDFNFKNILYFLKDRRNEAQHPGKRFTEKDCDKLLGYLTEYVDYFVEQK